MHCRGIERYMILDILGMHTVNVLPGHVNRNSFLDKPSRSRKSCSLAPRAVSCSALLSTFSITKHLWEFRCSPKDASVLPSSWFPALRPIVFERIHKEGGHFAAYEKPGLLGADVELIVGKLGRSGQRRRLVVSRIYLEVVMNFTALVGASGNTLAYLTL
ncbi:hypothetical protein F4809DRAFT_213866 [Biscogniauxia mediterranea]|nr:hypothetical protein F4809DRAFT_213866 [Biscogniauxia mediterranea]